MNEQLLLGIDVGTSGSKAVLVTPHGKVVKTARRSHSTSMPRPGWFEHDARGVWWADCVALCREVLGDRTPSALAGIGLSGIGPCLLPTAADGQPLRPAILYGIDTRADLEVAEITAQMGAERILHRCGSTPSSQAVGPKLLWLRRNEPDVWSQTRMIFTASSYLVHCLTGEYVLDHHTASQFVPLYDLLSRGWAEDWAAEIADGLDLPRLAAPAEVVGALGPDAARELGLRAGIPVIAGTVDAWAEAVSVGVRELGDMMLMYGSTMFMLEAVEPAVRQKELWTTAGVFPGETTMAAGLATSGTVVEWVRALTGEPDVDVLDAEASDVPPGSNGLVILPYFAGERTPIHDPEARGLILGLSLSHQRGHLYRAVLEGTAFAVRHNLEYFTAAGAPPRRIVAIGGGASSDLWVQIVSDVTGLAQELTATSIGASYGDAFLAGVGVGLVDPLEDWSTVEKHVFPDPRRGELYTTIYDVFRDAYSANRDGMHHLARIQGIGQVQ